MQEIDMILQAEKDAGFIRQTGKAEAEAILKAAEEYRSKLLTDARERGEAEKERLAEQARIRADNRCTELDAVAAVKDAELREQAQKSLDKTAAWLADRIAEV